METVVKLILNGIERWQWSVWCFLLLQWANPQWNWKIISTTTRIWNIEPKLILNGIESELILLLHLTRFQVLLILNGIESCIVR